MLFISDPTLTTDNVAQVIELLNNLDSLSSGLFSLSLIPHSRLNVIKKKYSTKEKVSNECASYYVHCDVQPSWTKLARHLYKHGEFPAVKRLKPFLPVRGKYQVISYASMNHALKACAVYVFCHWFAQCTARSCVIITVFVASCY